MNGSKQRQNFSFIRYLLLLAVFAATCLMTACDQSSVQTKEEHDEPSFRRADSFVREQRYREALSAYLKVIDKRHDEAPESHLEAGKILLDHLNDPISAIYHFRKYLEMKPQGDKSIVVRQLIETAQKEFAKSLPGQPAGSSRIDLLDRLDSLQQENLKLKQQVVSLQSDLSNATEMLKTFRSSSVQSSNSRPSVTQGRAIVNQQPPTNTRSQGSQGTGQTSYVVQSGDTLSKISSKVYGTPNKWRKIFLANKDQMANPNALKVGQTLKIPQN